LGVRAVCYAIRKTAYLGEGEMKINCWELKECGREPGGKVAVYLGVCPAATEERFNEVHGGKNAGRACWLVAGTLCGGKPQGTFAQKIETCEMCDFFLKVKSEEQDSFMSASSMAAEESEKR
jgi:hypothetical protein